MGKGRAPGSSGVYQRLRSAGNDDLIDGKDGKDGNGNGTDAQATAGASSALTPKRLNIGLAALLAVYISNQWSRSLVYYMVDFSDTASDPFRCMNLDLNFDQGQYGVLASIG